MFLWPILQLLIEITIVILVISQIIYPAFFNKPFFWFFKKSEKDLFKAQNKILDLNLQKKVKDLEKDIKKKERDIGCKR